MISPLNTLQFWPCSNKPEVNSSLAETQWKKIKKGEGKWDFFDLIFLDFRTPAFSVPGV